MASTSLDSPVSGLHLMLDHILQCPGSYLRDEMPLRTMYALNCQPRAKTIARTATPPSNASSPDVPQGRFPDNPVTQTFTQNLMAQMSQLPNQPASLPPSFLTTFAHRCFPEELVQVDFPQALTGLDYLRDLEMRRRREVKAALDRLDVHHDTFDGATDTLAEKYPGVVAWIKAIDEKERKIDHIYSQVYVGLRRWILINELSLLPFNRHNCIAMLNTLYPPVYSSQPTQRLTQQVLQEQREGFFKYIQSVERSGPRVLTNLMSLGAAINDANGWPAVTRSMNAYLQVTNSMIHECQSVGDLSDMSPRQSRDSKGSGHSRKTDSGVSFGGSDKRPTSKDSNKEPASPVESVWPKTPSGGRPGTALEKIARGLMTIGRSKTDVTEMIPDVAPAEKPKSLRKMRSLSSLGSRDSSRPPTANRTAATAPAFDVELMRQERMKYETKARKHSTHEI